MKNMRKSKAFILTEMVVCVTIILMLMAGFSFAMWSFGAIQKQMHAKEQCLAAVNSQLDSIAASGNPLDSNVVHSSWPGVEVSVETLQGQGQWQGLDLVTVSASTYAGKKQVSVSQQRYINLARMK